MISDLDIKKEIIRIGARIYDRGYIAATDGNISFKLRDRIFITASGAHKGALVPENITVVDLEGKNISGRQKPTSELPMHIAVYKIRKDVNAVIHAHPPYATALSLAGLNLPDCILPEVVLSLGSIPTARYATPSSHRGAEVIEELISKHDGIILDRHGTLTVGKTLEEAYNRLDRIEHSAKVTSIARQLGEISPLPKEEVDRLIEIAESMGVRKGKVECTTCNSCRPPKKQEADGFENGRIDEIIKKIVAQEIEKIK